MKQKINWFIRIILGSLFIVSAISKLFPIEAFDLAIVNQGITNWDFAPYLSRFIISVELFLGISFFITPFIKKISIPYSFLLLVVFCVHLILLISAGNGGKDCGCFGELIPMSSIAALIKNLVLIFLIILLNKYFLSDSKLNYSVPFGVYAIVFAGTFLIFQITPYKAVDNSESLIDDTTNISNTISGSAIDSTKSDEITLSVKKDDLSQKPKNESKKSVSIFGSFHNFSDEKNVNLDEGQKLVCLFSLDCEDCMETAHKLGQAKKEMANFPQIYILFLGEENQVNNFFDAAAMSFPYKIISAQSFFPLIKNYPPRIVLLNNGRIIGDWGYENFSVDELEKKF